MLLEGPHMLLLMASLLGAMVLASVPHMLLMVSLLGAMVLLMASLLGAMEPHQVLTVPFLVLMSIPPT